MSDSAPSTARQISLATAISIVVANMVGTGVFVSLGYQVIGINSGFSILLLWAIGGVLSFCGAVCYAELAASNPRSGGEYHLLGQTYHPLIGFLSGWISVTVGFAAPIALAAFAFGKYFSSVFESLEWLVPNHSELDPEKVGELIATRLAIIIVVAVTLIHLFGIHVASKFQIVFTVGKVVLIVVLVGFGFAVSDRQGDMTFVPAAADAKDIFSKNFAISLYWVMYAYTGWNAAAYVAGEMKNPQKNVPLALLIGTGLVTVLYILLNAAFLYTTPREAMMGHEEVGVIAANHIFSGSGGRIMGALICFGLVSTISAMVWAGPRVTQVIGEDYRPFRLVSRRTRNGAPVLAIILQSLIVIIMLGTMTFRQTLFYIQALLTLSAMITALGVIWSRWKDPGAERTYRAFAYPITPILFGVVSGWMLYWGIREEVKASALGLITLVVGWVVYAISSKISKVDKE